MTRLIDILLSGKGKLKPPPSYLMQDVRSYPAWREATDAALQDLRQAQVFVIDNVSKFYYETQCKNWDLLEDFPTLAPPFDAYWMEYKPPTKIVERVDPTPWITTGPTVMRDARGMMGRTGALFVSRDVGRSEYAIRYTDEEEGKHYKFELIVTLFMEDPNTGEITAGAGITWWGLDEHGGAVAMLPCWYSGSKIEISGHKTWYAGMQLQTIPMYLATSFLHCKNVRTTDVNPPAPLSKKWQKKSGKPLCRYKVLEIDPMKKILEHEGQAHSVGLEKALHICRGHFKDYRQGEGLGRYKAKGLWWWDAHLRGHIEQGVVDKEYVVKKAG